VQQDCPRRTSSFPGRPWGSWRKTKAIPAQKLRFPGPDVHPGIRLPQRRVAGFPLLHGVVMELLEAAFPTNRRTARH
jgi:hypothetical protein